MKVFAGVEAFEQAVGSHLGYSDWHAVEQHQVDLFADATGDHQWIHTDAERALQGPFGTTIAHGYLTLSLVPTLIGQVYRVDGVAMAVNYGCDRVRFPAPVPVGSRLRAGVELLTTTRTATGLQAKTKVTVARAGGAKPACVVETLVLLVP